MSTTCMGLLLKPARLILSPSLIRSFAHCFHTSGLRTLRHNDHIVSLATF